MAQYRNPLIDGLKSAWSGLMQNRQFNRGAAWGTMIIGALAAFEIFNFSTTQFALHDMLGDLTFAGLKWSTILAIAFCSIDFAGIARIFTPEQGRSEPTEVYYLFGAWVLAAAFNACLTWWGVSVAIQNNSSLPAGGGLSTSTMTQWVPVFIAAMVWLVRLLIIGTFSLAGDRLFSTAHAGAGAYKQQYAPANSRPAFQASQQGVNQPASMQGFRPASQISRPAPKPASAPQSSFSSAEPTYHPVSYGARAAESERHYDA